VTRTSPPPLKGGHATDFAGNAVLLLMVGEMPFTRNTPQNGEANEQQRALLDAAKALLRKSPQEFPESLELF